MTFRVATWNLDHASNNHRPIGKQLERIHSINADIWVLTETCDQVDLSGADYHCKTPYRRNQYEKFWTTVWTRFPLAPDQDIHGYDDETITCAEVETPGGRLLVYGTILTWKMDPGPKGTAKPWEEHHMAIDAQGDDWARLLADRGQPLIVAGDLNQTRDGSRRYCSADSIAMLDAQLTRNHLECVTDEDFGAKGKLGVDPKKGYYRHNVDHICLTASSLRVVETGAWDHFTSEQELSDHNGVFVDLAWRSQTDQQQQRAAQ